VKSNNISIILYFRDQRELAEQTLTALFENMRVPFELYVVDDASGDGTPETIRSVIEFYAHDETYFFENPTARGRALSVQDILPQCTASVIWMPVGFTTLDGEGLRVALDQLRRSDALFAVSGAITWPESINEWAQLTSPSYDLDRSGLPDDNQILIRLKAMPPAAYFVNPYLSSWLALEWMVRQAWEKAPVARYQSRERSRQELIIEVSQFVYPIDDRRLPYAREAVLEIQASMRRSGVYELVAASDAVLQGSSEQKDSDTGAQAGQVGGTGRTPDGDDGNTLSSTQRFDPLPADTPSITDLPGTTPDDARPSTATKKDFTKYTAAFVEIVDEEPELQQGEPSDRGKQTKTKPEQILKPPSERLTPEQARIQAAGGKKKAETHVLHPFGRRTGNTIDPGNSSVAASLKSRLEHLIGEGDFPIALREISEAVQAHPGDADLVRIKIKILERMRRYVEAAELKHKLKLGVTEFKVRREKIMVVDPGDDTGVYAAPDPDQEDAKFPSRPVTQPAPEAGKTAATGDDTATSMTDSYTQQASDASAAGADGAVHDATADTSAPAQKATASADSESGRLTGENSQHSNDSEMDLTGQNLQPSDDSEMEQPGREEAHASGGSTEPHDETPSDSDPAAAADSASSAAVSDPSDAGSHKASPAGGLQSRPVRVSEPGKTRISVVIPTACDGKKLLESALIALSRHAMQPDRELIVVDNASLDETYRYLGQLQKDRFMNIRVITNTENKGFAASVNQGMDAARGEYVFVMHTDVIMHADVPGLLADLMDIFDDTDVMGPVSGVSFNPEQRMHQPESDPESLRYADYADSFAMLIRRGCPARFDERFELGYFEDVDFCQQLRNAGRKIAIARGIGVDHRGGATAAVLGLEPNGRQYWKNASQFNEKWDSVPSMPFFDDSASPIFQLITISETINPYFPEQELLQRAQRLLTSETRHEMVQTAHARNDLYALIRLMMVLDIRDVLRQLEQQLEHHDLDEQLRYELIDFYYRKHIYSRGEMYLHEMPELRRHFDFKLLQLRILMGDKKLEEAAVLLNKLMDERPAHPELYKITADLHKLAGNRKEAAHFYMLAHQANPYVYNPRRDLMVS